MLEPTWIFWLLFNLGVLALLALDMGVFHRGAQIPSLKSATLWSLFWISLALLFNACVYIWMGSRSGVDFLTGYLLEKSLSIDNIFIFAVIFKYFRVAPQHQYRVLFLGILGALLMRAGFIFGGIALMQLFNWMIYVFGALLLLTGLKMAFRSQEGGLDLENNYMVRWMRSNFRLTKDYHGDRFFVKIDGLWWATPLLVVLLIIEMTDLIFAIDSIPAILAITQDSFIVYTSNVFAILGLRSLYFALSGMMDIFHHLHYGLGAVLVFVGFKMLSSYWFHVPAIVSLGIILGMIAISVITSLLFPNRRGET